MYTTKEVSAEAFFSGAIPGYAEALAERDRLREVNAELLAALEAVVLAGGAKETTKWRMICMLDHARAAIAKAKGGEA